GPGRLGDDDLRPRRARDVEGHRRSHSGQGAQAQPQRSLPSGDGERDLRAGRGGADPESIEPGRGGVEGPDVGIEVRADGLGPARAQEVARGLARLEADESGWTGQAVDDEGSDEGQDEGGGASRRGHRASARRVGGGAVAPPTADGGTRYTA